MASRVAAPQILPPFESGAFTRNTFLLVVIDDMSLRGKTDTRTTSLLRYESITRGRGCNTRGRGGNTRGRGGDTRGRDIARGFRCTCVFDFCRQFPATVMLVQSFCRCCRSSPCFPRNAPGPRRSMGTPWVAQVGRSHGDVPGCSAGGYLGDCDVPECSIGGDLGGLVKHSRLRRRNSW